MPRIVVMSPDRALARALREHAACDVERHDQASLAVRSILLHAPDAVVWAPRNDHDEQIAPLHLIRLVTPELPIFLCVSTGLFDPLAAGWDVLARRVGARLFASPADLERLIDAVTNAIRTHPPKRPMVAV